jgi:porphobilinogen deaminase
LTETTCKIERDVLRTIKANCNSPIGLFAKETYDAIQLRCDIFDHSGKIIFSSKAKKPYPQSKLLGIEMGDEILATLGQSVVDNLDNLENDFDYTPDR